MQLIDCIPKKFLRIHGFDYEVYEPVLYKDNVLSISLNGKASRVTIRTFSSIRNPDERHRLFRDGIRKRVNDINRIVEKEYVGDNFRMAKEDTTAYICTSVDKVIAIGYLAQCLETFKAKRYSVYVGRLKDLTEQCILDAQTRAGMVRLKTNQEYNRLLTEKRKKFRELVDQQVMERDTDIVEEIFLRSLEKKRA